jgi:uncharacterized RDD family membrane protein YckC
MTDPAGGVPNQGEPAAPPAAEPVPPLAAAPAPPPAAAPPPPAAAPAPPPAQAGYQAPQGGPAFTAPTLQQAAVEAGPAPGIVYADLVTRIIALVIDYLILFIPFVLISLVLAFVSFGPFLASLIFAGASAGYFVYTWTKQRATYGQKFQKLECVNAADGATLTQEQAIRRWAFLFGPSALVTIVTNFPIWAIAALGSLLGLVVFGYLIYLLYSASQSPKRQGFHDVQAGTVVVKRV